MKKNVSMKNLLEEVVNETVARAIKEEFIGNVGGVNLYQMGGSIKRPELYNLDSEGKPTRDPGVAGVKRKKKRSKKNEAIVKLIKTILISEIESKTIKMGSGRSIPAATPTDEKTSTLERVFKAGEFSADDISSVAQIFLDILQSSEVPKYANVIENLPNIDKFNNIIDKLDSPRVARSIPRDQKENIKKIVGKMSNTIEIELEKKEKEKLQTSQIKPQQQKTTKKSPAMSIDVGEDFIKFAGNVQKFKSEIEAKIKAIADSAGTDKSTIIKSLEKAIITAQSDIDSLSDRAMFVVDALRQSLPTAGHAKPTEAEKELLTFVGEKLAMSEGKVFNHLFGDSSIKNAMTCAILLCVLSN